jgi:hypothetical protein
MSERPFSIARDPEADYLADGRQGQIAKQVCRGVLRLHNSLGVACVPEVCLPNGRRADVMGVSKDGTISIIEIKSSLEDYRGDAKWRHYLEYCDTFAFAIPVGLDEQIFPLEAGLIVADAYGATWIRTAGSRVLSSARRKSLLITFGQCAAQRLSRAIDPEFGASYNSF